MLLDISDHLSIYIKMEVVKIQGLISKFPPTYIFLSLMVLEVLEKSKGHRVPDMQTCEDAGQ
jgi:hypothetical protein